MKKTTKKVAKKETIESLPYEVSFKIFGKVYKSTGETIREALDGLVYPGRVAGVSILTVSHGDNKKERILGTIQATRLFSNSRIMREVAIKNMTVLFDNL